MSGQRFDGILLLIAGLVQGMTIPALIISLNDKDWLLTGLAIAASLVWIGMAIMLLRRMPSTARKKVEGEEI